MHHTSLAAPVELRCSIPAIHRFIRTDLVARIVAVRFSPPPVRSPQRPCGHRGPKGPCGAILSSPTTPLSLALLRAIRRLTGWCCGRASPQPLTGGGMPAEPVEVEWQVAEDEQFSKVVRQGTTTATPEWGHSVHVEVDGLRPARWYWYQFKAGTETSPKGAPTPCRRRMPHRPRSSSRSRRVSISRPVITPRTRRC